MTIVDRAIFFEIEKYFRTDEIIVVTGCRQTGKTTTLRYFFEKVDSQNKLFLDLENVLNRKYFEEENYETIKSAFEFLGLNFSKKAYIFIDEIQYVKNLPSVVKYLKEHYKVKFFLTGSASFYLKNLFSESLSGRKYIFNIYPLTFKEFIKFKGYKVVEHPPKILDRILESLFQEYINFGGFPGVALKKDSGEKRKKIQDIFSSYFEMEVEKLKDFAKLSKVRDTLLLLFSHSTLLLDVSKLSQELGITRITLKEYLDFFEKTFFFDFIKPFSQNKDVEIRKRAKIYPVDVGLAREFGTSEIGKLFEIAVYQNIKVKNTVNYYRKKSGVEIDFIVNKKDAFEVKVSPYVSDVSKLIKLFSNLKGIGNYKIVSLKKVALKSAEWAPYFCLR